jgi:hypothetical protein
MSTLKFYFTSFPRQAGNWRLGFAQPDTRTGMPAAARVSLDVPLLNSPQTNVGHPDRFGVDSMLFSRETPLKV